MVHRVELLSRNGVQDKTKVDMNLKKTRSISFVIHFIPNFENDDKIHSSSDGLLLYLDDGGYYDFLELKLVN